MIIDFQQGIITYPASGSVQQFLTYSNGYVSLSTSNGRVDVAFTHGVENYLHTESISVPNAWGPINTGVNAWLYWDIDKRTAVRTFGVTYVQPSFGPTQPTSPVNNQHWFDTNAKQMKVYKSSVSRWTVEIRVFAAKLTYTGTFSPMGSNLISPYAGTQAGLTSPVVRVGRILVDVEGKPIRKSNGAFFTTEDLFFSNGSPVNAERFDAAVLNATAMEPTAAYQIVKYVDFGEVVLATYNDTQETAIALTAESIDTLETGAVCIQGVITNPDWDWHVVGAPLWIHGTIPGYFTDADPHVSDAIQFPEAKPPVARVLTPHTIYFDQGLGGLGTASSGPITLDGYVLRTGDTMSGNLSLPSTQNSSTHATTKGYVDGRTLTHLADVTITSPTNNQQLVFNGIEWVNATPPAVATNLNELTDVTITSPADLEVLQFNGTEWVNALLDIPEATAVGLRQIFTATAGQTTFTGLVHEYVVGGGQLTVYINGIQQYPTSITELTTTSFALSQPVNLGDKVMAEISTITPPYIQPPTVEATGYKQLFVATPGQTVFGPLTNAYVPGGGLLTVFINGIMQYPSTVFELSTTTFEIDDPVAGGDEVLAVISDITPPYIYPPTATGTLDGLTDVIISTPMLSEVLSYDGTQWINAPLDIPTAVGLRQVFTATADQVVFTGMVHPYVVGGGQLTVYINGIQQYPASIVELTTTSFSIPGGVNLGDMIMAEVSTITPPYIQPPTVAATGYKQKYTATAGQTTFTGLSNHYVVGGGQLSVYINGIMQYPDTVQELSVSSFSVGEPSEAGDEVLAVISDITPPYIYPPTATGTLDGLTDVIITTPTVDDMLTFNGTNWVNTGGYVKTGTSTVINLPPAATVGMGARYFVTDATTTTFLSIAAGGGANKVPVVSDGTNWLIG